MRILSIHHLCVLDATSLDSPSSTFLRDDSMAKNPPAATAEAGSGKKRHKAKSNKLAKDNMLSRIIASEDAEATTPTPREHKKKKGRPVPKRVVATPRSGPAFDAHMYDTPLDWRPVYTLRDRETVRDAFARVREVQRQVEFDLRQMRNALRKRDWYESGDDSDARVVADDTDSSGILAVYPARRTP
ncbi:uncharacterized protein PGRI_083500 [Penicillium griseofulvum]|uniref:Uncharacterized protein n=1 Tax=Penicillium patulum TaxID=5078 RepID=A0A135LT16_PENPA|nr:uncharacterized protein PGRI_083500 [Penicillium griseofulvum]KXG52066.1 hypothetical protein PGRI_083500 [Penicillium griseofulvum]